MLINELSSKSKKYRLSSHKERLADESLNTVPQWFKTTSRDSNSIGAAVAHGLATQGVAQRLEFGQRLAAATVRRLSQLPAGLADPFLRLEGAGRSSLVRV